jgi:alkylation response protein AidB-like acyl-CoA dehydrogenase
VEIAHELGKVLHTSPVLSTNVVALAIAEFGSEALRREFLPGIVSGITIGAWCSSGVVQNDGDVVATRSGSGYRLSGTARFVQDGAAANLYLVTAGNDAGGLSQFAVRRDTPGLVSTPMACFDLCRQVSEVRLDDVEVPASTLLGDPGQAEADAARQLVVALVLQTADTVGALGRVNEFTFEYCKDRFAFGRPIGSFQAIKHKCAEMYLGHLGARAVLTSAAAAVQARSPQAETLARMAKAYACDAYLRSAEHCHQFHGGISFTWEHHAHLYSRHATFNASMFGTPDWHRDRLAAGLGI